MYALTGLFLSLALFFASICGPGTYWEMTVIDPIFEVTAPGGEKAGLDLTGLGLTLGLGGDEAGENGILRVSGHFGSETQSAAAFLRDGLATVILDGFDALLTASLVDGEDLSLLLASLHGEDPDAAAALAGWVRAALSGEENAPVPEGISVEKPGPGEERFFDGELMLAAERTEIALTGEAAQALAWQAAGLWQLVTGSRTDPDALEERIARLEGARITLCRSGEIWHMALDAQEDGQYAQTLQITVYRSGNVGRLRVAAGNADTGKIVRLDADFEGQEAGNTVSGPMRLELTAPGGGSARLDCGLTLRAAPLEGYANVVLPGDMDRIDVSTLSEADVDRLQALLTTRLAVNLLRAPELMAVLRGE